MGRFDQGREELLLTSFVQQVNVNYCFTPTSHVGGNTVMKSLSALWWSK